METLGRLPKSDAPEKFWGIVEPYCADITNDDMKVSWRVSPVDTQTSETWFVWTPMRRSGASIIYCNHVYICYRLNESFAHHFFTYMSSKVSSRVSNSLAVLLLTTSLQLDFEPEESVYHFYVSVVCCGSVSHNVFCRHSHDILSESHCSWDVRILVRTGSNLPSSAKILLPYPAQTGY